MRYKLVLAKSFKKDYKRISKQRLDLSKLDKIVQILLSDRPIPRFYNDHSLKGNLKDLRELHIQPDWILIYRKIEDLLILVLSRTGSHADLLKK
ncbi:MAG: type II toxin-antitoxin system YafQ family toxin [Spirochaetia bacterium]|nr:type II toxin-antitoxin system YafQ family toxin [Spirochaetia bacterium]